MTRSSSALFRIPPLIADCAGAKKIFLRSSPTTRLTILQVEQRVDAAQASRAAQRWA
jgi:hypothetical protein